MKFKKILAFCITLSVLMLAFIPSTYATTADGMIFSAESIDGTDYHNGHGSGFGLVTSHPYPIQGLSSYGMYTSSDDFILCFEYNGDPSSEHVEGRLDLTGYTWVELDLYYQAEEDIDITCDFQFSLIGASPDYAVDDHVAQHGHDFDFPWVHFPANQWTHVKMMMDDAVFHSPDNRDSVDIALGEGTGELHYAVDLSKVVRSKYQFGFLEDIYGDYPMEGVTFLVDNVHASKTDSGMNNQLVDCDTPTPPLYGDDPQPTIAYGDIDGNGGVTSTDALLALQKSIKKIELTDDQFLAADVDGNKQITSTDSLLILQYSIKKIDKFPVEN